MDLCFPVYFIADNMYSPKTSSSWNVPHSLCTLSFPSLFLTHFLLLLKFSLFYQTQERFWKIIPSYFYHSSTPLSCSPFFMQFRFPPVGCPFILYSFCPAFMFKFYTSVQPKWTYEGELAFLPLRLARYLFTSPNIRAALWFHWLYIAFFMSQENHPSLSLFAYSNQNSVQRSYLSA